MTVVAIQLLIFKKQSHPSANYLFIWTASNSMCVCFFGWFAAMKSKSFSFIQQSVQIQHHLVNDFPAKFRETIVLNYKPHFNILFKSLIEPLLFCL